MLIQDDGVILADPGHTDTTFKKLDETDIPAFKDIQKMAEGNLNFELHGTGYTAKIMTSPRVRET